MNNFKCESCGRNMGDIDEPICHQCEVAELDAIETREQSARIKRIEAERNRIMAA